MNAETRAKELFGTLAKMKEREIEVLRHRQQPIFANWNYEESVSLIAAAIRQAENDKLEEAADAATKFLVGDPFNGVPLRSPGPHEIAAHIRSLIQKD